MYRNILSVLVLLLAANTAVADKVYRWQDERGIWHLSDSPPTSKPPPPAPFESRDARGRKLYSDRSPEELRRQQEQRAQQVNCYRGYAEVVSPVSPRRRGLILLGASWCPVTDEVRAWLVENRVRFREYDVERTARGRALYTPLEDRGLPVILVGKHRMHGFYADALSRILGNAGY